MNEYDVKKEKADKEYISFARYCGIKTRLRMVGINPNRRRTTLEELEDKIQKV